MVWGLLEGHKRERRKGGKKTEGSEGMCETMRDTVRIC